MTSNGPGPDDEPRQQNQSDRTRDPGFDPRSAASTITHPERLRRSRSDRKIAGVCGGLGRQLGVDPTIIRVLMVVLALTGGLGIPLYLVLLIVMPEEGADRSVLDSQAASHLPPQVRSGPGLAILLGVVVLIASGIFTGWFGDGNWFGFHLPLPLLIVGGIVAYFVYRAKRNGAPTPAWVNRLSGTTQTTPAPAAGADGRTGPSSAPDPSDPGAPGPEFWARPDPLGLYPSGQQPEMATPPPAPVVRRTRAPWRTILGTIACAAGSLVVLSIVASAGASVPPILFAAIPTAIIGLGLVAAARRGGSRLLVTLGVITGLITFGATRFGPTFDGHVNTLRPATVAEATVGTQLPNGFNKIDLRGVDFPNSTTTLHYTVDNGVIDVVLPPNLDVRTTADISTGAWDLFNRRTGAQSGQTGADRVIRITDTGDDGPANGKTKLNLDLQVAGSGLVRVER